MSTSANPHGTQHGEGSDYAEHFVRRRQRLGDVLYMIAALEFATIFFVANFAASFYYWVFLQANAWPALYVPCALVIASLIVLFSAGFRHYVKILSHRKRWYVTAGIGTAILAFSVFLSLLFLLKLAEIYSRGAFFFQLFTVTTALVGVRAITHNKLRASIAKNTIEARRVVLIGRYRSLYALHKQAREGRTSHSSDDPTSVGCRNRSKQKLRRRRNPSANRSAMPPASTG